MRQLSHRNLAPRRRRFVALLRGRASVSLRADISLSVQRKRTELGIQLDTVKMNRHEGVEGTKHLAGGSIA